MYRYCMTNHASRNVMSRFELHRSKLGKIYKVVGRRYLATRPVIHDRECVMVYGDKGVAKLYGCCWGYSGEGPRAVYELLLACGVPNQVAKMTAFESERNNTSTVDLFKMPRRSQIDWEVVID